MANKMNKFIISIVVLIILILTPFIIAVGSNYDGTISYLNEEPSPVFNYNLTKNITYNVGVDNPLSFNLRGINSSLYPSQSAYSFYNWITLNSNTGILIINSTRDNETGRFNITLEAWNQAHTTSTTDTFFFIVNATNDAPSFTSVLNEYNFTQNTNASYTINGTDEERHWSLYVNLSFSNCSLAPWSNRDNCTLVIARNRTTNSSIIILNGTRDDVGSYTANISIMDNAENYTCNNTIADTDYCDPNYRQNKTVYYSRLVNFNVFSVLDINVSNCNNTIFNQNQSNFCILNITVRNAFDTFNFSSNSSLRNFNNRAVNTSWFFYYNRTSAFNYTKEIYVNFTPQATEVGNWSVNLTLWDLNFSNSIVVPISVYVNKTLNYAPIIPSISSQTSSVNASLIVLVSVYDDDMLIPDKNQSFGGYNETLNFTAMILNQSDLSQILTINGRNNLSVNVTSLGLNSTNIQMAFTPNQTSGGNYTINLSATDRSGVLISRLFNLSILSNNPPAWSLSTTTFTMYENNMTYINFSINISDPDGDEINFTFINNTLFPNFNLNLTTGVSNFTPEDSDVGEHLVNITVRDPYYIVTQTFNFTIYNVNDNNTIKSLVQADVINASVDLNSFVNVTEDNSTKISLYIDDGDFNIPVLQRNFYNESISLNLTISGINSSLFEFVKNSSTPNSTSNRTHFYAIFTPRKADVGDYNISANFTDMSNLSNIFVFNLSVSSINHNPVLSNISNLTSAVSNNLYYIFNVTDIEDGDSSIRNTNFSFNYSFLDGSDFIINNNSIFNTTSGILNITFNSSQGGSYRINLTVNDSEGLTNSKVFFIFIYDIPVFNFPESSYLFSLVENNSYNLTFKANHSMNDNLTYTVYYESWDLSRTILYNTNSYYGNNSNLTIAFSPNFTQETGGIKSLTAIAYASTGLVSNINEINKTQVWNFSINHTNYPLSLINPDQSIGGDLKKLEGGSPLIITLSDYFLDYDANDPLYNQTILFNISEYNSTGIGVSVTNWINGSIPQISFSSSSALNGVFGITANEYNQSNSSDIIKTIVTNNFSVYLTVTETTVAVTTTGTTSGGGGGDAAPISFKIVSPGVISALVNQKVSVPLKIVNYGKRDFGEIKLSSKSFKDAKITNLIVNSLDKESLNSLKIGESKDFKLDLFFNTNKTGDYEVLINASSLNPVYDDWVKVYINLRTMNKSEAEKYLLFTQDYIVQNPQCIELKEVLDEANVYFEKGDYTNARAKAEEAINACKEYVSQVSLPKSRTPAKSNLVNYLIVATLISFVFGIFYYMIKRRRFTQSIKMRE